NLECSARGRARPNLISGTTPIAVSNLATAPLSLDLKLFGDGHAIGISNLVVNSKTSIVTTAEGFLPVSLHPSDFTNKIHFESDQPLQLVASAQPDAAFWDALTDFTGVVLREPNLSANLSGTWAALRGNVQMSSRQIQFRKSPKRLPTFESFQLALQLDREHA